MTELPADRLVFFDGVVNMSNSCGYFKSAIPDALSSRLDAGALAELDAHCEICAECAALYNSFQRTAMVLETAFPRESNGRPQLWRRIQRSVRVKSSRLASPPKLIPVWGPIAAAAAMIALAVLLFAGSPQWRPMPSTAVATTHRLDSRSVPPLLETPQVRTPERGPREVIDDARGLALLRNTGPVFVFDGEHQAWRQVVAGERVPYGAALRTAPGALAELAFGQSRVRVDEKSEVSITSSSASTARVAELTRGRIRIDLLHSQRPFVVRSAGGEVELTGTVVDVDTPVSDLAFVQVLEGHVIVTPAASQPEGPPLSVTAGQEALVASRINDNLVTTLPESMQIRLRALRSTHFQNREAHANWADVLDQPPSPKNSAIGQLIVKDERGRDAEPLRIISMDVKSQVRGPESITRIDQSFYNSTAGTLEGTFYFNVPPGAAISRFAMYVDEKTLVEGEVVERGRARAIYESILHAKRDPALLEWVDGNTFKARVFPIAGHSNKRIIMEYTQVLPAFFDTRRYVFPLVSELAQKTEIGKLNIQVELATGDTSRFSEIASPSYAHQTRVDGQGEAYATAKLTLEHVRPAADFVLNFSAPRSSELYASAYAEHEEAPYILLGYQPRLPASFKRNTQTPGRDILFVAETSGARTHHDLDAQCQALNALLAALNDDDRVAFAAADVGMTRLTDKFVPARSIQADAAVAALKQRVSMGALDLSECLRTAAAAFDTFAENRERIVLFIGSGVPALGILDSGQIVTDCAAKLAESKSTFIAVSLGQSVDALTLSGLARRSNGFYLPLKTDEGLDVAAFQLALSLQTPLLTCPVFKADANTVEEIYPAGLGALLPGQEIFLSMRANSSTQKVFNFVLTAELAKVPFESKYTVVLPSDLTADPATGRFWARTRLDHLLAQPQTDALKREVIDLAKTWTLMSPYTSFLVLESNDEYKRYDIDRSKRRPAWRDLDAAKLARELSERDADAVFARGMKLFENLEYGEAKKEFEHTLALQPKNEAAKQKLQIVESLLSLHVDRIARKIRELEQNERIIEQESLVQLATAISDARRLEEKGKTFPALEDTRDKEQVLADQLDDLRKSRDKFRRCKEILNWMPATFDLPRERAEAEEAIKRTWQEISEKEDELSYIRRVASQREADGSHVRESEMFTGRIKKLNEQVKDLYDRGDYKAAERLSKRILEVDPFNAEAKEWQLKSQTVDQLTAGNAPIKERDGDELDETTIGYAPIILYPSNWDTIAKRVNDLTGKKVGTSEKLEIGKEYQGLDTNVLFGDFGDIRRIETPNNLKLRKERFMSSDLQRLAYDVENPSAYRRTEQDELAAQNKALADQNLLLTERNARIAQQQAAQTQSLRQRVEEQDALLKDLGMAFKRSTSTPHSPNEQVPESVDLRIYDISDLVQANGTNLTELIKFNVKPTSWNVAEGVSAEEMAGRLVVMQRKDVQDSIQSFLSAYRANHSARGHEGSKAPSIPDFPGPAIGVLSQSRPQDVNPDSKSADVPFPGLVEGPNAITNDTFSTVGSIVNHRIDLAPNNQIPNAANGKSEVENELNATRQALAMMERDTRSVVKDLQLQTGRTERLLKAGGPIAEVLSEDPPAVKLPHEAVDATDITQVSPPGFQRFNGAGISRDLPQTSTRIVVNPIVPQATLGPSSRHENENPQLLSELNAAKQKLAIMTAEKRAAEEDLALQTRRIEKLLKNGVPVAQLFGEDPSATQPFVADGRVLAVKPDLHEVMLSIGSAQGVKPGYQFVIKRGDSYVHRVAVEKVYPDMCMARFVDGLQNKDGREVEVNDEVISGGGGHVSGDRSAPDATDPVYLTREQIVALLAMMPGTADVAAGRAELYRKLAALSTGVERCRVLAQGLAEFKNEGPHAEMLAGEIVSLAETETNASTLDAMLPLLIGENLRARVLAQRGAVEVDVNKRCDFLIQAYETSGEPPYLQPLAMALQSAERHRPLIAYLEASIRTGGSQSWMWPMLSAACTATGDSTGALRALTQAIALQPREAQPRIDFAHTLDRLGRGTEAIREMRLACVFGPERIDSLRDLCGLAKRYSDSDTREWALLTMLRNDWPADGQAIWAEARTELDTLKAAYRKTADSAKADELEKRQRDAEAMDIMIVMSWNTDKTDIDLHVQEPGNQLVSYNSRTSFRGGNLDRDVRDGFGPEIYTLRHAAAGRYSIKAHYYSGQPPTEVTVKVTRHKGSEQEKSENFQIHLEKANDEQAVTNIDIPTGN